MIFQPGRQAGDAYEIQVHFPHYRAPDSLDLLDDIENKTLNHALRKATGTFETWRELHIVAYWRKAASQPAIQLGAVADYYKSAYVKLEDKSGGPKPFADYDVSIRASLMGNLADGSARFGLNFRTAMTPGDQGVLSEAAVMLLSYDEWTVAFKAARGFTDLQLTTWLTTNDLLTAAQYNDWLDSEVMELLPPAVEPLLAAADGITLFQFNGLWELTTGGKAGINGYAMSSGDFAGIAADNYAKGAYVQSAPPENYAGGKNNVEQTTTHEIGHLLFLPHASTAPGSDLASHDATGHWNNCTMSYNYDKVRKFCGLCLLRLRGWDKTPLSSSMAANKKG